MKILFLIQRSKINKRGLVPVMCRLTHKKQRKEFSTGIMVKPKNWIGNERKLENSPHNDIKNSELEIIQQQIHMAYLQLEVKNIPFDLEDVLKIYNGETLNQNIGAIQAYTEHNLSLIHI